MKKGLGFLFVLFLLMSCSDKNDENDEAPIVVTYGVTVEKTCKGSQTTYCVSKATYDKINAGIVVGDPCHYISFTDNDNVKVSGYLRSLGSPCNK